MIPKPSSTTVINKYAKNVSNFIGFAVLSFDKNARISSIVIIYLFWTNIVNILLMYNFL